MIDSVRRPLLSLLSAAVLASACGGASNSAAGAHRALQRAEPLPIESVHLDERPPLTLVTRGGDPQPAVAFVARHARGGPASAALVGLLLARLDASGIVGVEARAHGLGVELSRLVDEPDDLEKFFEGVRGALATEVRLGEAGLSRAERELAVLGALSFAGKGESAVADCSGELGLSEGSELDIKKPEGIARLEAVRAATFKANAAAFAVLGPQTLLREASGALSDSPAWPTDSADGDRWPAVDLTLVDRQKGKRQLSVAWWVPDADTAVGAGVLLGAEDSSLLARLRNLTPAWRLTRASAVARRQGACLRLDLAPPEGDPGPSGADVGRVAALVERSALFALQEAEPGALDESILRPSDPRRAAVLAAWRALPSVRAEASSIRRTVAYIGAPSDTFTTADLVRALGESRARLSQPSIEVSERLESGQGELWMLLASPCGTATETASDAGAFALVVRSFARAAAPHGVRFEPWITPDGVGLLAHGPRQSPSEPAQAQASRIAAALGRALTSRLEGVELGSAREQLLKDLGGRAFPGFTLALEGLSPEHPSWLEPRGLWQSVSDLPSEALERARKLLVSSPLRLAVLSNAEGQAGSASTEVESWLMPWRAEPRACPSTQATSPRRGLVRVEAREESGLEGAYVGVSFGAPGPRSARMAELSALLLNRPGGFLERALTLAGHGATARAHALGGTRRPSVLIDIRALPERLSDAIDRVRTVLDQLAQGAVSPEDLARAANELAHREARERFDPRRRIVDLWRGGTSPQIEISGLRAAHAAFGSGAHWVVSVVASP